MKKRILLVSMISIGVFVAVLALVATTSLAFAARWGGHQTGGGDATVLPAPPPIVAVSPATGTSISFGMEAKADSLVPAAPPAPPGTLQAGPGATIRGHGTWIDHSTTPPRMIRLTNPSEFRCDPVIGRGTISGWGTDSSIPGPVFVIFGTIDGQALGGPPDDGVFVRVLLAPPPPPPPFPPLPFLYGANATASGEVVQHSCQVATTSVALAARWRGHQTGGGAATVEFLPFFFPDLSPPIGTLISFGIEAKADSLVPSLPPAPPGALQAAPGATIQGHGTWVDHSTSPPRIISLTNPAFFGCSPVTGRSVLRGLGTDSSIPGPVFVIFSTTDGQAPSGPPDDQVEVRVFPASPPAPPLYVAFATVRGEVVQHSCQ